MLTKGAVKELGCKVAATVRAPRERRKKFAQAVATLVKKASLAGAATTAATKIPWGRVLGKIMPYLGMAGAGAAGGYLAGKKTAPTDQFGGGGGMFGGGQKPLWGQHGKRMLGRMGINPQEEAGRTRAMRDIGAGGQWRAQAQKERERLIRSMFTN